MKPAPLHTDIADAPEGGAAWWLDADDGVRIRIGTWPEGERGTVLLLPGRTEYVEKYGRAAGDLRTRGFATATIDWRGQGFADRMLPDPVRGHVDRFTDYQRDLRAMMAAIAELDLPRPYYLIGHSMGGAIATRALAEGLEVRAVTFSAPMWGIWIAPHLRPFAWILSWLSTVFGFSDRHPPNTLHDSYVATAPFEDNMLTTDQDMFDYMRMHLERFPELALGGPTLGWLHAALREVRHLQTMRAPAVPMLTWLGTNERIVDMAGVRRRAARWPGGELRYVEGAEHEVLMEAPEIRNRVFDDTAAFFRAHP